MTADLDAMTREELVAEVERLHSWDGLMELLDEHFRAEQMIRAALGDQEAGQ